MRSCFQASRGSPSVATVWKSLPPMRNSVVLTSPSLAQTSSGTQTQSALRVDTVRAMPRVRPPVISCGRDGPPE